MMLIREITGFLFTQGCSGCLLWSREPQTNIALTNTRASFSPSRIFSRNPKVPQKVSETSSWDVGWQDKHIWLLSSIRPLVSAMRRKSSKVLSEAFGDATRRFEWNKRREQVCFNTYLAFSPARCSLGSTCFPVCWKWRMNAGASRASQCNWTVGSQIWERHKP